MERRRFLGCSALAPLVAELATAATQEGPPPPPKPDAPVCRITVVRRAVHQDLADQHLPGRKVTACDLFKDGQEFVLTQPWQPPQGFCPWAWADIRTYVMANVRGGSLPLVACCTDGVRPVHFKIEPIGAKA